mgnify:CR=1 FL=1
MTINGADCPPLANKFNHSQIQCTLPAGNGINQVVTVTTNGQSGNFTGYNYGAPVIQNVSPSVLPTSGGDPLTITGVSFGNVLLRGTVQIYERAEGASAYVSSSLAQALVFHSHMHH